MNDELITPETALDFAEEYIRAIPSYPRGFEGRGVVICGGGKYFASAWVAIKTLRGLDCSLPIQLWYLGPSEVDSEMRNILAPLGVECVDAYAVRERIPARILNGWEVKPYSIIHSPFKEVLFLDADNMPLHNPETLFESEEYEATGALFWPDRGRLGPDHDIWRICGVPFRDEPEIESGQIVVDKERCWAALSLCMWYNEHSDFYYRYVHGDKETFHLAFRKMEKSYAMPSSGVNRCNEMMYQYDFNGNLIFQHQKKWDYYDDRSDGNILNGKAAHTYMEELRKVWDGRIHFVQRFDPVGRPSRHLQIAQQLTYTIYDYELIGRESRPMIFCPDGTIGRGWAEREVFWDLVDNDGAVCLEISSESGPTCRLVPDGDSAWRGRWEVAEKARVRLSRVYSEIQSFIPVSGRRRSLSAVLDYLQRDLRPQLSEPPVIVEIGGIRDQRISARETHGWSTVCLGWYASRYGATFHTVDNSEFHLRMCRSVTRCYGEAIDYRLEDGIEFLRNFHGPIALLYLDAWENDVTSDMQGRFLTEALVRTPAPNLIVIDDVSGDASAHPETTGLLTCALAHGYCVLHQLDNQLTLLKKPS